MSRRESSGTRKRKVVSLQTTSLQANVEHDHEIDLQRRRSESSKAYAQPLMKVANAKIRTHMKTTKTMTVLYVYIFGYCYREGKRGSRAAYGVYIYGIPYKEQARHVSAPVSMYAKQTSKVASLHAFEAGLESDVIRNALRSDVRVIFYIDDPYTLSMLTYKGAELESQQYPPRSNYKTIRRVREAMKKAFTQAKHHPNLLPIDLTDARQAEGYANARRMAKSVIDRLRHTSKAEGGEKEMYELQDGCAYDDTARIRLNVPPHDRKYALSKGAWWDWDEGSWYTYGPNDLGIHYDMTRIDLLNLLNLYKR
jgi:hypothetical protein